jgi:hypothetical protein
VCAFSGQLLLSQQPKCGLTHCKRRGLTKGLNQITHLAHPNLLVQDEPLIKEGLPESTSCLLDDVDSLEVATACR